MVMRVLIVDDHPIVRRGLRELLQAETAISAVVGEAGNPEEALTEIRAHPWDVVLLDLAMPGRAGLNLLTTIHTERPQLPVLVVSAHPEDQFAVRLLRAGAAGYVTKETAPDVLIRAVQRVAAGGKYISETLGEYLAGDVPETGVEPHQTLSNREYEVLTLIAEGKTVTDIADRLCLSVKTVSTYRTRLLEKLGAKTTAELIRYAVDHHLTR
jgi:two-component system invasion response regulator UvrY